MEEKVLKMLKCRALFLYSLSYLYLDRLVVDDYFLDTLDSFLSEYLDSYFEYFDLMYDFYIDNDGDLCIREEKEWNDILNMYLRDMSNSLSLTKIYDDIGFEDVEKISRLAELFFEYSHGVSNKNVLRMSN